LNQRLSKKIEVEPINVERLQLSDQEASGKQSPAQLALVAMLISGSRQSLLTANHCCDKCKEASHGDPSPYKKLQTSLTLQMTEAVLMLACCLFPGNSHALTVPET
jgi:hypothetical protein